jgi:hypothetical protein
MPDDPPKLNGAVAESKGAAAVPKGAGAPSPLPLAAATAASPDMGELLGGPHVKLKPPVSPHSPRIRVNSSTDMYVPLERTLSLTSMCAWGVLGWLMNMAEQQDRSNSANKYTKMSTGHCACSARSRITGSRAVPAGADDAAAPELNAAGWLEPKAIGAVVTGPG